MTYQIIKNEEQFELRTTVEDETKENPQLLQVWASLEDLENKNKVELDHCVEIQNAIDQYRDENPEDEEKE